MRILFVCNEKINNDFSKICFLNMLKHFDREDDLFTGTKICRRWTKRDGPCLLCRLLHQQHHTHVSLYSRERASKKRNWWIKSLFFSLCTKKYSHSFITLRLNHWCCIDYFNNVLTYLPAFLGLERGGCAAVYARSYGFGMTWGWVINDRIFIFGWTLSLICWHLLLTITKIIF